MAEEIVYRLLHYGSDQVLRATLQTLFGICQDPTEYPIQIIQEDQGLYDPLESKFLPRWYLSLFYLQTTLI